MTEKPALDTYANREPVSADFVEKLENSTAKFFRQNLLNHPSPRGTVSVSREDLSHCQVSVSTAPSSDFPAGFLWVTFLAVLPK
ncbi:hypothetical protein [Sulfitobacter sediminilitoris]|uniref:hypothetical protein n=1 Tax=Sulfitobacter sediminilitoris TaxID=2698830 RepID=UPI003606785F